MSDVRKYDPATMPFDVLIELHSRGERIACPECGNELQISVQGRRTAHCSIDRKHFHIFPSTAGDREELDAMFDQKCQSLDVESSLLLEEAAGAYCEGRFPDAFPVYEKLAATGSIEAICGLALMYLQGEGAYADVEQGLALLRRAVSLGHANSAFNLGALYRSGACGVPKNSELSKQFFRRAKELGCDLPVDDYL